MTHTITKHGLTIEYETSSDPGSHGEQGWFEARVLETTIAKWDDYAAQYEVDEDEPSDWPAWYAEHGAKLDELAQEILDGCERSELE